MRWVKRGCWVAAWSVWIWLGFGLARELPRDLGPVVCKLPISDLENVQGFLGGESVVVTMLFKEDGRPSTCRLWDVDSRTLKFETPANFLGSNDIDDWTNPSLGCIVTYPVRAEDGKKSDAPLQMIDLRTGERRILCSAPRQVCSGCFHDRRHWMTAVDDSEDVQRCECYDLQAGKLVFDWRPQQPPPDHRVDIVTIGWIPESDFLLIAYWVTPLGFKATVSHVVEVWNVAEKTRRSRQVLPEVFAHSSIPAANGRIVLSHPSGRPSEFDVLDSLTGDVVLSNRHGQAGFVDDDVLQIGFTRGLTLSENGRCLMLPDAVWNLDRRRLVWTAVEGLEELRQRDDQKAFFVAEDWNLWLFRTKWPLLPRHFPTTWAIRDLETGSVRCRVYDSHPYQSSFSSDGTLSVHRDGAVYRMPHPANWPLLALCQTILALPLILLWAALRWRRKRRLRLASLTP